MPPNPVERQVVEGTGDLELLRVQNGDNKAPRFAKPFVKPRWLQLPNRNRRQREYLCTSCCLPTLAEVAVVAMEATRLTHRTCSARIVDDRSTKKRASVIYHRYDHRALALPIQSHHLQCVFVYAYDPIQCQNIINKPRRLSGHSGAPSYSTNTPAMMSSGAAVAPRVSSGGGGFGMSTRASALNNRAISRWSDAGGSDSGRMHEMQMMAPSKTHHMSDPVRFNSNNASSSSTRGYASLGGGSSPPSAANANSSSMTARRRSFGSATNDRGGGYGYEATGSTSMRTGGGEARSSSRPRGRFG